MKSTQIVPSTSEFIGIDAIQGLKMLRFLKAAMLYIFQSEKKASSRHSWADLCRILATFGVVMIHACGPIFYQYGKIPKEDWLCANLFDSFFRCSVPLFIMLSGAMLLGSEKKEMSLHDVFRRIQRVVVPLVFWSLFYLIFVSSHTGMPVKWLDPLFRPAMYHLGFVYMIIGIYLLLPVFLAVFQFIRNRCDLQAYLLAIWFVANCLPIYMPIPLLTLLQQNDFFGYGGYFLLGGILVLHRDNRLSSWVWAILFIAGFLATFFLTKSFTESAGSPVETPYVYLSPNVFLASLAAFMLLARIEVPNRFQRPLIWVSDKTFLIYLMHVVVLEKVSNVVSIHLFEYPKPLFLLAVAILTFLLCLASSAAIRLIPFSRSLFG